jgi:hypothetical protein
MNLITDKKFFSAGKAIFTVKNPIGTHYTYRINHPENKPCFVMLLTGQDNTNDYTYLGIYDPDQNNVRLTAKSKYNLDSTPVKVVKWAIKKVANNETLPEGYAIQHEGKCCRCGRTLTTPESIDRGIGPECMTKF